MNKTTRYICAALSSKLYFRVKAMRVFDPDTWEFTQTGWDAWNRGCPINDIDSDVIILASQVLSES